MAERTQKRGQLLCREGRWHRCGCSGGQHVGLRGGAESSQKTVSLCRMERG